MARRFRPLPKASMLLRRSIVRWRELLGQTLLIALIWVLIRSVAVLAFGQDAFITELWFIIVLSVLVWFYGISTRKSVGLRQIFYDGSAGFVKLFLVMCVWVLYLVPFAVGVYFAQHFNLYQFSPSTGEIIAVSVAWLLLATVSAYWIIRSFMAPILLNKFGPLQAIRASWDLTQGKTGWAARSVLLVGLVAVVPALVLSATLLLPFMGGEWTVFSVNMTISFLMVGYSLPLLVALGYEMEKHGKRTGKSTKTKK